MLEGALKINIWSWIILTHPREGNGNPLQYCCLGNPMNKGDWRESQESDMIEQLSHHHHHHHSFNSISFFFLFTFYFIFIYVYFYYLCSRPYFIWDAKQVSFSWYNVIRPKRNNSTNNYWASPPSQALPAPRNWTFPVQEGAATQW